MASFVALLRKGTYRLGCCRFAERQGVCLLVVVTMGVNHLGAIFPHSLLRSSKFGVWRPLWVVLWVVCNGGFRLQVLPFFGLRLGPLEIDSCRLAGNLPGYGTRIQTIQILVVVFTPFPGLPHSLQGMNVLSRNH